jgi:hypothetical protein
MAALKDPGPESFKLATSITFPPRPPIVMAPNPSAPGKAETGISEGTGVYVSVTLVFGVSVGVRVTTGSGTGKQLVRFTETNMRRPIRGNKLIPDLFTISPPRFWTQVH